jgi:hypothetical protein
MFALLTLDAARDAVARQFQIDDAHETAAADTSRPTAPGTRRANPLTSLARQAGDALMRATTRATWSPTR